MIPPTGSILGHKLMKAMPGALALFPSSQGLLSLAPLREDSNPLLGAKAREPIEAEAKEIVQTVFQIP